SKGLFATVPVPFDWPEQEVQVIDEVVSPTVKQIHYRMTEGAVRQMLIEIPLLPGGSQAKVEVTFEVKRRDIFRPDDTSIYSIPRNPPRDVRKYLADSPLIESRNPKIRDLAKELIQDRDNDWAKVEAIYDHVRKIIKYKEGPLKGALAALRDGDGDCE